VEFVTLPLCSSLLLSSNKYSPFSFFFGSGFFRNFVQGFLSKRLWLIISWVTNYSLISVVICRLLSIMFLALVTPSSTMWGIVDYESTVSSISKPRLKRSVASDILSDSFLYVVHALLVMAYIHVKRYTSQAIIFLIHGLTQSPRLNEYFDRLNNNWWI